MCKHCGGTFQISEDAQSGIHFLTKRSSSRMSVNERPRTYSAGSTNSVNTQMGSTAGSLHRVASVTSVLKRIFSRSDGSQAATVDGICSIITSIIIALDLKIDIQQNHLSCSIILKMFLNFINIKN